MSTVSSAQTARMHPVDRFLRATVTRVTSIGPPPPQRVLAPFRRRALVRTLELYRERGDEIGTRLRAGDEGARPELAALAAEAIAFMRDEVRRLAGARGWMAELVARGDARWNDCDADELLDDPELDQALRTDIMATLDCFNDATDIYERFLEELLPLARTDGPTRVLDLAAGHGGFALAAARRAREHGLDLRFTATDLKREYLDMGEEIARREALPVRFAVQDAFDLSNIAPGAYDIVLCTQSLHHFPPGWVALMFEAATRVAGRHVLFIDACRSALSASYAALYAAVRRRPHAWVHDAWVSTRKAFVPDELELLARIGGWGDGVESRWLPPAHCLLRYSQM